MGHRMVFMQWHKSHIISIRSLSHVPCFSLQKSPCPKSHSDRSCLLFGNGGVAATHCDAWLWPLMTTHWEEKKWTWRTLPTLLNMRLANEKFIHPHPARSLCLNSTPSVKGQISFAFAKKEVRLFVFLQAGWHYLYNLGCCFKHISLTI